MMQLSIRDHSRDVAGMTYVYPVVSRRAGGISVGINLNPNNACNWRCIYCQVPNLRRGGPPPIDLAQLEAELREMLAQLFCGDYLSRHVPPEAQRVVDIAFSGNGEPTSAAEFPEAVALCGRVLEMFSLPQTPRLRLITNGSLLDRRLVQEGIATLGRMQGEVWFKLDVAGAEAMRQINGVGIQPKTVLRRLRRCGGLCETWIQTCLFLLDGMEPGSEQQQAYIALLRRAAGHVAGVHLYGLARPSQQLEASRLFSLPATWMDEFARQIEMETGLSVRVSP